MVLLSKIQRFEELHSLNDTIAPKSLVLLLRNLSRGDKVK